MFFRLICYTINIKLQTYNNKKMSKFKIVSLAIISIIFISYSLFLFLNKDAKIIVDNKLTVCYAPKDCKTFDSVAKEAIKNIIGRPEDFHRESSKIHIDTQEDFKKGRFDEKAFYFKYLNHVYYFINAKILTGFSEDAGLLENSNADTFQLIDANFSKDKKNVYGKETLESPIASIAIKEADPQTFVPLDWPYARDDKNIFYLNKKITEADTNSFKILENKLCASDKNNYYKDAKVVNKKECQ